MLALYNAQQTRSIAGASCMAGGTCRASCAPHTPPHPTPTHHTPTNSTPEHYTGHGLFCLCLHPTCVPFWTGLGLWCDISPGFAAPLPLLACYPARASRLPPLHAWHYTFLPSSHLPPMPNLASHDLLARCHTTRASHIRTGFHPTTRAHTYLPLRDITGVYYNIFALRTASPLPAAGAAAL